MGTPSRFTNGVTNVAVATPWGNYVSPAPVVSHTAFEDWNDYTAGQWTITTSTGSNALAAGNGGIIALTTAASDTDIQHMAKNPASFAFAAGKQFWFSARCHLTDATDSIGLIGLQTGGTAFAPTDGVYFKKLDTVGTWTLNITASSATTTLTFDSGANAANSTYQVLSFYYDGRATPTLYGWVADASDPATSNILSMKATQTMTNLPSANLSVALGVQAGAAAAKTLRCDYIFAANEVTR